MMASGCFCPGMTSYNCVQDVSTVKSDTAYTGVVETLETTYMDNRHISTNPFTSDYLSCDHVQSFFQHFNLFVINWMEFIFCHIEIFINSRQQVAFLFFWLFGHCRWYFFRTNPSFAFYCRVNLFPLIWILMIDFFNNNLLGFLHFFNAFFYSHSIYIGITVFSWIFSPLSFEEKLHFGHFSYMIYWFKAELSSNVCKLAIWLMGP